MKKFLQEPFLSHFEHHEKGKNVSLAKVRPGGTQKIFSAWVDKESRSQRVPKTVSKSFFNMHLY